MFDKTKKLSIAVAMVHFFNAAKREKKDAKNLMKLLLHGIKINLKKYSGIAANDRDLVCTEAIFPVQQFKFFLTGKTCTNELPGKNCFGFFMPSF